MKVPLRILVSTALLAVGSGQSAAQEASVARVKGADLPLLEEVRGIGEDVERLRGEEFVRRPIAVRVADTMRDVAAEIRAFNVIPKARLEARGRAWADLGLGDASVPMSLMRSLADDLEGIGFDPSGNRLLVSPDRLTANDFRAGDPDDDPATVLLMTGVRPDGPLVAHLLMHVRQRERAGRDFLEGTTDRLLATVAWAEGEANLIAIRYLFEGMGMADEIVEFRLDPGDVLNGSLVPAGIDDLDGVEGQLIRFVYGEGFAQAAASYRAGGWKGLDQAMSRRRTTRDVLHPDRAVASPVDFPPPPKPAVEGLTLVDEDSLGEQGIIVLISKLTGKDNLGLLAGDGWKGDRLYRWEAPGNESLDEAITEWVTRWSSPEAAADFDYAIGRSLTARHPYQTLETRGEGLRLLAAGTRVYRVQRRGDEVRLRIAPAAWDARMEAAQPAPPTDSSKP